jgi:hypothetical protein
LVSENGDLTLKLLALEKKYDQRFREVFEAIHALMASRSKSMPIGFGRSRESE